MKPTAIIAHENPIMLCGFSYLVEQLKNFHTIQCQSAEAVLSACKENQASLVITSFTIPNMGALQLTNRLKALSSDIGIIVSASESSGFIAEKCIQSGAHGYITSSIGIPEFLQAVEAVSQKSIYTQACVSQRLALKKISGAKHIFDSLSPREFDIFSKVILDKTTREVAGELFLAEKTVANYISIIKKKLHANTSAGLVRIGIKEGFFETLQP